MRIYPVQTERRAARGPWTLGLTALFVLACRDSSVPIIGSHETPPTEIARAHLAYVEVSGASAAIFLVDYMGAWGRLSPRDVWDQDPAWSPDGSRIAFASGQDGKSDIYVMNANGGNRVRLTADESGNSRPAWSHDGSRIAFASRRDGNSEIYVMNADGSHQSRLTFRDDSYDSDPAWSPDGTRIAFATSGGILVITTDGAEIVRLTSNNADAAPAWSPDGSRIAFSSYIGGTSLIFVINADGSGRELYSPYGWNARDPSWSPDGSGIAYAALKPCDDWEYYPDCTTQIFIRSPDGSIYSVPKEISAYPSDPAWQP